MGKDDTKEDSGFGFKDKAKAEETLKLLESHEPQYRRLTVRGLLGRAKRVLSLTKAEEKIKNIKEAMSVFENWLEELDKEKQSKDPKKTDDKAKKTPEKESKKSSGSNGKKADSSSESSDDDVEMAPEVEKEKAPAADTVPGLGFKDKEAAEKTLEILEGRDPDYQKLAVKGLIGRAKRVLTCTKDDTKLSNIKEAISILDNFLDDFDRLHLSRKNNSYLPLSVVEGCAAQGERPVGVLLAFMEAYKSVGGEYKKLRTVKAQDGEKTWDIVRNEALKELKEKHKDAKLFDDGSPTEAHRELILWAYSPEESRVKKLKFPASGSSDVGSKASGVDSESRKRKSSGGGEGGEDGEGKKKKE